MSDDHLHVVHGPTDEQQDDDVGDEESSAAILEGCEGKAPDVAQTHGQGDARHKQVETVGPSGPFSFIALKEKTKTSHLKIVQNGPLNYVHYEGNKRFLFSLRIYFSSHLPSLICDIRYMYFK